MISKRLRISSVAVNILTAIIYIILFRRVYVDCLYGVFDYYGFKLENTSFGDEVITNILSFLPILLYRPNNKKASDFVAIMIYVMIYVPSLVSLQYYYTDYSFAIKYQLVYLVGMCLFFLVSRNRSSMYVVRSSVYVHPKIIVVFSVIIALATLIVFRGNIKLVSFEDVYGLRETGSEIADSIPLFGYFYQWMSTVFSPVLIGYGCYIKNKKLIIGGFALSLLFYMTCGMKSTLFIPILSYVLYKSLDKDENNIVKVFPWLTLGLAIPYFFYLSFQSRLAEVIVGLILMRTYGIAAYMTPIYIDVFQQYPYTYYSHITIVDAIFGMYPFATHALGMEVNQAYGTVDQGANMNANFMVTDGIAAGGLLGVIIISVLFYFFLIILNRLTNRFEYCFVVSIMTGAVISLTNNSLFTTLLTCGLLVVLLIYKYIKVDSYGRN